MTTRTLFLLGLCGVGAISGAIPLDRFVGSAKAQQAGAAVEGATDGAQIQRELERLKSITTDQAHVMVSVAYHFNNLWFAAQHGNWPLAEFYLNETRAHLRWAVRVIPVRKNSAGQEVELGGILAALESTQLEQLRESIAKADRDLFVDAYRDVLDGCNACHGASEKQFIHVTVPAQPAETMIAFVATAGLQEQPKQSNEKPQRAADGRGESEVDKKSAMLIEPAELQERLKQAGLLVLDSRSQEEYGKSHIPGAVRVEVKSWQELGKKQGGWRDAEAWADKAGEVGLSADSHVVVYGSNLSNTARVWWLLKYLGADEAMILDGGWDVWTKEGRPADSAVPAVAAPRFTPRFDKERLAEIDPLKDLLRAGSVKVVDTRSKEEFTGKDVRGKRGGHIPGATHLEWKELLAQDGRFKKVPELQELFRQRGILPTETAVCY